MVGRQTSRGCGTCRRRKVKCDLGRPSCTRCINAGRLCLGYLERFVRVPGRRSGQRAIQSRSTVDANDTPFENVIVSQADRLRNEFVWKLETDALAARLAMVPASHVLRRIPQRIGFSQALDDAVTCITRSPHTRSLYAAALASLRHALEDEDTTNTSETLAAASLLQMYEQHVDEQSQIWTHHARGVIKMLRLKGSDRITDELEKAVLEAQAVNIFTFFLSGGRSLLLTNPIWSQVARRPSRGEDCFDIFTKMIVDGIQPENDEELYLQLLSSCRKDASLTRQQCERIINVGISDFIRVRARLKTSAALNSRLPSRSDDAALTSAYAASAFFLVVADTILLGMYDQYQQLCGHLPVVISGELLPHRLALERSSALEIIPERFEFLDTISPAIRTTARVALRVIIGAALGSKGLSTDEAAVTLLVLDQAWVNL